MAAVEDIGIDLGSSRVIIYMRRRGIVLNEPALLAVDQDSGNVIAIGTEAHRLLGRERTNLKIIRPLDKGAVQNYDMLAILLNHFVMSVIGKHFFNRPRAVLSVSAISNEVEKRQLLMGMFDAGARRTQLLDRPMAAALGAGVAVTEHFGRMVVDIGGATTDMAIIASGEIMARAVTDAAGDMFTDAIIRYVRLKHNLLIGFRTAEDLKHAIGTVYPGTEGNISQLVAGRNLVSGLPKQMEISRDEVFEAMEEPLRKLMESFHSVIERVPPELANDVFENGILLTGGGAEMKGLQESVTDQMQIRCVTAEKPQECIAVGCGMALERASEYQSILGDSRRRRR